METLLWGLRELRRFCLFAALNQRVVVECGGYGLQYTVKGDGEDNLNFEKHLHTLDVVSTTYLLNSGNLKLLARYKWILAAFWNI